MQNGLVVLAILSQEWIFLNAPSCMQRGKGYSIKALSITDRLTLLRKVYQALRANGKFIFDVFTPYFKIVRGADDTEVGQCDLCIGHNDNTKYGGNIGYEIYEPFRGNHYALRGIYELRDY